jgi:hypothetical protein
MLIYSITFYNTIKIVAGIAGLFGAYVELKYQYFSLSSGLRLPDPIHIILFMVKHDLSWDQLTYWFTLRYPLWRNLESYTEHRANLIKTFKSPKPIKCHIKELQRALPKLVKAGGNGGHEYEALCRKIVRNKLKSILMRKHREHHESGTGYFDYGTKRDRNGASAYAHPGDLRYDANTDYPHNQNLVMIDVSSHLTDSQLSIY